MKLNLKEAEELLKTYQSISYFTILKEYLKQRMCCSQVRGIHVMNKLTGFGYISSCKLCQSASKIYPKYSCLSCIYNFFPTTCQDVTYNNLSNAKTPFQIWKIVTKKNKLFIRSYYKIYQIYSYNTFSIKKTNIF